MAKRKRRGTRASGTPTGFRKTNVRVNGKTAYVKRAGTRRRTTTHKKKPSA